MSGVIPRGFNGNENFNSGQKSQYGFICCVDLMIVFDGCLTVAWLMIVFDDCFWWWTAIVLRFQQDNFIGWPTPMKQLIRIDRGNFKILRKKTLEKDVWRASVVEFGRAVCRNINSQINVWGVAVSSRGWRSPQKLWSYVIELRDVFAESPTCSIEEKYHDDSLIITIRSPFSSSLSKWVI